MRPPGQISQKLKQASFRHLKRELDRLLAEKPQNCVNNVSVKTRTGPLGVCKLDCKTCDALVDNRVEGCASFKLEHSAEELKASLKEFLRSAPAEEIAVRFPDLAVLVWVLDNPEKPERGKLIPDSSPTSIWGIDLWVDTPEEVEALVEVARTYEEERALLGSLARDLETEATGLPKAIAELKERLKALERDASMERLGREAAEVRARAAEETVQGLRDTLNSAPIMTPPRPFFWWVSDWSWLPWRH